MHRSDSRYSYNSDVDTTHGSNSFLNQSSSQVNRLEDGTLEIIDTLPKKEYYMSLRNNGKSKSGSLSRVGSVSSTGFGTMSSTFRSGTLDSKPKHIIDFKPSGKMMECIIIMLDGTEEIILLDRKSYGQHLFDLICEQMELNEREYFGITYQDKGKVWYWLDCNKRITKQVTENRLVFEFHVKFYPKNTEMIIEELTRYYFGLQIRQDIITGALPCSFTVCALLGAYVIQSEAGDYNRHHHQGLEYLRNQPLAPADLQTEDLLYTICEMHKTNYGQSPEEADRLFLENSRKLALYGVDRHKVKNCDGDSLTLGIHHGGILLYKQSIRLINFSWARLVKVSYKQKKVIISVREINKIDTKNDLIFKCQDEKLAKRLYQAVVDHHSFFRMIEARTVKKPNLQPGFATRKYYKGPRSESMSSIGDRSYERHRNSNVKRHVSIKDELIHDDYNSVPSKNKPFSKRGLPPRSPLVEPNSTRIDRTPRYDATANHLKPLTQEYVRPMLPQLHWRMSPADCTPSVGMDEYGLDIASQHNSGWQGCRSNKGVKMPGEYFYESCVIEEGMVRLGWSTNDANLNLGTDNQGYGYGTDPTGNGWGSENTGRILHDNFSEEYGSGLSIGDYVGCRINLNNGDVSWYKNGEAMNAAYKIPELMRREPIYPTLSLKDGRVELNFGETDFVYPPCDSNNWTPVSKASETNQVLNKHIGWKLNAYEATNGMDVSADGLMAQAQLNEGWQGSKCNKGVKGRGKYYFEASPLEEGGLARVGWATDSGSLDLGTDGFGFGYGADSDGFGLTGNQGKKMFRNDIENYGKPLKKGDIIGCMLNLDEGLVQWSLNGEKFSAAYSIPMELRNGPSAFYPTVSLKNNTIDMNFGEKMFKHYPGNEWMPLTYTPTCFLKESRKRGPERKLKGLSYLNTEYLEDIEDRINHQQSGSMNVIENEAEVYELAYPKCSEYNEKFFDESVISEKLGHLTVTNGPVTDVESNEPIIETETYIDEYGNQVTRTTVKTKTITKTTKTIRESFTERQGNEAMISKPTIINKSVSWNNNDDIEDIELRDAILSVTSLDGDVSINNDYIGSLGFVSNKLMT